MLLSRVGKVILTLAKSGGGFFPLQRLERAQTKFLVIDNLVDLVRTLLKEIRHCMLLN